MAWQKKNLSDQQIFEIQSRQKVAKEEVNLENIRARYRDKADLNEKILDLTSELDKSNEENRMLKEEIESLKETKSNLEKRIKNEIGEALNQSEKEKFESEYIEFEKSELYNFFSEFGFSISKGLGIPNVMDDLVVEKFLHSRLVKEVLDDENRVHHVFTKKGRYFWENYITNSRIIAPKNEKNSNNEEDSNNLPF